MLQVDRNDLDEILMDLNGMLDLLTVVEASEYYAKEDAGVFRSLRNSLEFTKDKFTNIVENAKEVKFQP